MREVFLAGLVLLVSCGGREGAPPEVDAGLDAEAVDAVEEPSCVVVPSSWSVCACGKHPLCTIDGAHLRCVCCCP